MCFFPFTYNVIISPPVAHLSFIEYFFLLKSLSCFITGLCFRLMYLSAVINGVAGTVFFAGPPLLASLWFPPDQRATATAISSLCIYAGLAGGFLIGMQ